MAKYIANVNLLFSVPVNENPVCAIGALTDKFLDVNVLDCESGARLIGYTSASITQIVEDTNETRY